MLEMCKKIDVTHPPKNNNNNKLGWSRAKLEITFGPLNLENSWSQVRVSQSQSSVMVWYGMTARQADPSGPCEK